MAPTNFTISPSSLKDYTNKTILITGGSSGIGLSTAVLLHELGNNIVVLDLTPPKPYVETKALINSKNFLFIKTDVTNWAQQRSAFGAAVEKFGRIDSVFVNAGIAEFEDQFFTDILDSSGLLKEPDRRVLKIDIEAAADTVKLACYWMRNDANHRKGRGGSIVMTSSLAGYLASAGAGFYSAAKHGIVGLMRALKHDVAKLGIAISNVAPGITVTPILSQELKRVDPNGIERWAAEMQKVGVPVNRPESVALAVVYLMKEGMAGNGAGIWIQNDRMTDVERGIAKSRSEWMGEEMLSLFRSGREAPLFPNKL